MGFRRWNSGSTVTEMGLIGAVVLVATLGLWFFLGDGLKQAFGLVKSDMLAQVSNAKANGIPVVQYEQTHNLPALTSGDPVIEPVQPTTPIITAGTNGNEAHSETYNALQALIDRSMKKGTMTEAQADILNKLARQLMLVKDLEDMIENSEAGYDIDALRQLEVQFKGQTYLFTDLAARLGWSYTVLDESQGMILYGIDEAFYPDSEYRALDELYLTAKENGLLDNSDVFDFFEELGWARYSHYDLYGSNLG